MAKEGDDKIIATIPADKHAEVECSVRAGDNRVELTIGSGVFELKPVQATALAAAIGAAAKSAAKGL